MKLTKDDRAKLIATHQVHSKDSGSPEVQIALLTAEIEGLTEHMKRHRKDFHSRQGLIQKVNRRNKLLTYLNRSAFPRYADICKRLGLRA